jgi:hypothetical protein
MIKSDPNNPRGIVWLASYPKSGNTWLRIFLYQLMRLGGGYPREADELNQLDRASMYESILFGLFEEALGGQPLATATRSQVQVVRASVHATIVERLNSVALVKTHNLLGEIGDYPTINMSVTLGGVYIIRDPRDVASSLAKHLGSDVDHAIDVMGTSGFQTSNQKEGAFEIWGSWSQHVYSWTTPRAEMILVVRYEDMLEKPTETFSAIVQHLRQRPKPEHVIEAIELSAFDKLQRQEEEHAFRERSQRADRFFVSGKAGLWRERLTPQQADRIAAEHGEQMRRFGYLD